MLVKESSLKTGAFCYWDDEKIKNAFNFGNGSKKDMLAFIQNNKKLAKFEIIEK